MFLQLLLLPTYSPLLTPVPLSKYNEAFDLLAFNGAKEKLHSDLGYPAEVLDFEYRLRILKQPRILFMPSLLLAAALMSHSIRTTIDPSHNLCCSIICIILSVEAYCRGLIIDKSEGNIIKVDRHKYVRKVCHGKRELSTAEKKAVYGSHVVSFTESNYVNIDTLFLLIDALLFTGLVDLADKNPGLINKSYEEIYKDVRACVDLCHKDGVIKDAVINDPAKHIIYDPGMVPMLKQLKNAGKKVVDLFTVLCTILKSRYNPVENT